MANQVLIKCPETNSFVPTGVTMSSGAYQSGEMSDNQSSCSSCGGTHVWGEVETVLEN